MPASAGRYYLTSPIYYVNAAPHIGHFYTTLACDVLARFMRLDGREVRFLTGTDEHGQKIEAAAKSAGQEVKHYCDGIAEKFKSMSQILGSTHDDFIRTTEQRHIKAVQALWQKLQEKGDIYLGSYAGWYAVRDEAFYGENELTLGPDGVKRAPSGAEVAWVEEPSYFFRLSAWQDKLLEFYTANPDFVLPTSRRNEVLSFVKNGLTDLSISRTSFKWGIPVPGDPNHVMYVWLDALTNYISALGYPDQDSALFKKFWPADLHMVGKDILRFHAIYWPAFLMAADLPVPHRVYAHGWWTNEGQKMSKSLANVIEPAALVGKYGLDAVRFFLLRELPFGSDGDFSHRAMVNRMNSELANDLGNLLQRVLAMVAKNCEGKTPQPGKFTPEDETILAQSKALYSSVKAAIERQQFHEVLETIWVVIRAANGYVAAMAPWELRKTDSARMSTVLYVAAEVARPIALLLQPFMPDATAKMLNILGVAAEHRTFATINQSLVPGTSLPVPVPVFPRFVEEESPKL